MAKHNSSEINSVLVKRLHRVSGHLEAVTLMVKQNRDCSEVLQQLSAVIAALNGTRLLLLNNHVEKCIKPALKAEHKGLVDELGFVLKQAIKGQ